MPKFFQNSIKIFSSKQQPYSYLYLYIIVLLYYSITMPCILDMKNIQVSPSFDMRGVAMISSALVADAVIGNVQVRYMDRWIDR